MKFPPLTIVLLFVVIAIVAVRELAPKAAMPTTAIASLVQSQVIPVIPSQTQEYVPVLKYQLNRAKMNNKWSAEHRAHYDDVAQWLDAKVLRADGLPVRI